MNLKGSNAFFARFCQELHRRGMKIILDGVFNHCGSFNRWMDREGIYKQSGNYPPGPMKARKALIATISALPARRITTPGGAWKRCPS